MLDCINPRSGQAILYIIILVIGGCNYCPGKINTLVPTTCMVDYMYYDVCMYTCMYWDVCMYVL